MTLDPAHMPSDSAEASEPYSVPATEQYLALVE